MSLATLLCVAMEPKDWLAHLSGRVDDSADCSTDDKAEEAGRRIAEPMATECATPGAEPVELSEELAELCRAYLET